MDVTKLYKKTRGRGVGSRGGRGRGRGRGSNSANKSLAVINLDDDDELCNMALAQAELENNSITMAFEALNSATTLPGFQDCNGDLWIYPINRPVRDYQYNIVNTALFNNTLVSLPTGLGKTFISAVVMFNFQRWYPNGIIVFMAPTRPLVTQQLDACHKTVGIERSKTVELTGQIAPKKRQQLWQSKRVFFLTPQVMLSDLERNFFTPESVRCIVVDEAHKATGNHAYVQLISKIAEKNRLFRVLALTATPGSDLAAVQQVFKNLLISRVELRTEDSVDLLPYIHEKQVETIVVKLDPYLKYVHEQILQVFQIYTGKLMKANILNGRDGTSYVKFQILKARETFRKDMAPKIPGYQKGYIESDFNVCISLSHAIELLLSHGLRSFYTYLNGVLHKEKGMAAVSAELKRNTSIQGLLEEIQKKLNISVENSTFDFDKSALFTTIGSPKADATLRSFISEDVDFTLSHPKLKELKNIVHQHFLDHQCTNKTTRVMIFSQYRDSVQEIGNMLNSLRPMVKPMVFIGQADTSSIGRGLKQKDQVQVVQQFRDGGFNVLVATCVGEEGLDIGEVDLIICFDASKSPTRLIQRMGRTGRQRKGRTVFLLTEGKEERSYASSISTHSSISKSIANPDTLKPFLYKQSPRMVPVGIEPKVLKMVIILGVEQATQSQPKPIEIDLEEDDDQPKARPEMSSRKQTTTAKKKKIPIAGTSSKKKNEKTTSNNIAKLFDRMVKAAAPSSQNKKTITSSPIPVTYQDDRYHDLDEGLHMFADHNIRAYSTMSIFPKIFETNRTDKLEWKPCTTFIKNNMPSARRVAHSNIASQLDAFLLCDKELAALEYGVKARESFSFMKTDFCACGNTIEPHEAERDQTCFNAPLDSITVDEPFIDEDFSDQLPPDILEHFDSPFGDSPILDDTFSKKETLPETDSPNLHNPLIRTPAYPINVLVNSSQSHLELETSMYPTTPVKCDSPESDEISEFSASPEVVVNPFLEKLNRLKAAKAEQPRPPFRSSHPASSLKANDNIDKDMPCAQVSSILQASVKKFKFKKKVVPKEFTPKKQEEYVAEMSPSPPLSPILNLTFGNNDPFAVPSPKATKLSHDITKASSLLTVKDNYHEDSDTNDDDIWEPLPHCMSPPHSSLTSSSVGNKKTFRRNARKPIRKVNLNPFIECEAEVSGDDSDGSFGNENEFEYEGLDDNDDSFVTQDFDQTVSDSQQIMYLESVKDAIPARFGRVERPLSPKNYGTTLDDSAENYEDDSFCQQDDDVEYMEVGVFTQAMNVAKAELAVGGGGGRQTRRGKREAAITNTRQPNKPKQRRRIVQMDTSSGEDDEY